MKTRQNTQNKLVVSITVALLVVGLASAALAQGPGQGRGGRDGRDGRDGNGGFGQGEFGPEMMMKRMAQRLDLTDDQVVEITKIREEGRAQNIETRKEVMRLRNEKRGEMLKDDPATKTVLALTTKIGDLRTEMQTNRMSSRLAVRKVLTPQQRDKMLLAGGKSDGPGKRGPKGKNGQKGQRGGQCGGSDHDCSAPRQGRGNK